MDKKDMYTHLPNTDVHNCFGCSVKNLSGLQMKFYTDGESILSRITVPEHLCGWNNVVHGGILSTILDEIMGWAGLYQLKMVAITKSMTVDFLKKVLVNEELRVEAKVTGAGSKREAIIEGVIYNSRGDRCAQSVGTFSLLTPALAKRLGIMNDTDLELFFKPILKA